MRFIHYFLYRIKSIFVFILLYTLHFNTDMPADSQNNNPIFNLEKKKLIASGRIIYVAKEEYIFTIFGKALTPIY